MLQMDEHGPRASQIASALLLATIDTAIDRLCAFCSYSQLTGLVYVPINIIESTRVMLYTI